EVVLCALVDGWDQQRTGRLRGQPGGAFTPVPTEPADGLPCSLAEVEPENLLGPDHVGADSSQRDQTFGDEEQPRTVTLDGALGRSGDYWISSRAVEQQVDDGFVTADTHRTTAGAARDWRVDLPRSEGRGFSVCWWSPLKGGHQLRSGSCFTALHRN